MKRERAKAFLQEFPILATLPIFEGAEGEELLQRLSNLYYIKVKRLDKATLEKTHEVTSVTGSLVGIFSGEEAYAFFPTKGWIGVKSAYDYKSTYAYDDPYYEEGENLLAVIDRTGEEPLLVAVVEHGIETINHHSVGEGVTLYKIPRGMDIQGLLNDSFERELERVRAEADF